MRERLESGRFFGRTVRRRAVSDLVLADVRYPAGGRIPRHSHERAYFCLIRSGCYVEEFGRRARTCRPMTLAFHPPGEPHAETFGPSAVASFNVEIGAGWLARMREAGGLLDQPAEFQGGAIATLGLRLFREFSRCDAESELPIESLTWEILLASSGSMIAAKVDRPPRWLTRVRDLLDASYAEPLTLRAIAAEAGIHPAYLASSFRRFQGCSVGEYLRRCRLECARGKLADENLSIAEVALEAGFSDQSHLTRTLKRFTGVTPAQYRTFLRFKTG